LNDKRDHSPLVSPTGKLSWVSFLADKNQVHPSVLLKIVLENFELF